MARNKIKDKNEKRNAKALKSAIRGATGVVEVMRPVYNIKGR